MTTRSAVTPPEAAAWLVVKHPEWVEALEREGRGLLSQGKSLKVAHALLHMAAEHRAAGRDFLASIQDAAVAQLVGADEPARAAPASVSIHAAAAQLRVGIRMVGKLVAQGRLARAGRGQIDSVSLALELARRAAGEDQGAESA